MELTQADIEFWLTFEWPTDVDNAEARNAEIIDHNLRMILGVPRAHIRTVR